MTNIKILTIIPARSGSKGISHKNIKIFKGKPLIAWSIEQVFMSSYKDKMRVIVSTDSAEYAKIANIYGAETPFLRPPELSQDLSTDYECIRHALEYLKNEEDYIPDIVLQLRPTQPCRKIEDINKCLDLFINNMDKYDSLRTVVEFEKSPYKMYSIENDILIPMYKEINGIKEPYNQCRQALPKTYLHNGYIDIFKASIVNEGTISGERIYPYIMDKSDTIDIDTMDDWFKADKK